MARPVPAHVNPRLLEWANRITSGDASLYLDLRFDHFEGLRAEITHQRQ